MRECNMVYKQTVYHACALSMSCAQYRIYLCNDPTLSTCNSNLPPFLLIINAPTASKWENHQNILVVRALWRAHAHSTWSWQPLKHARTDTAVQTTTPHGITFWRYRPSQSSPTIVPDDRKKGDLIVDSSRTSSEERKHAVGYEKMCYNTSPTFRTMI